MNQRLIALLAAAALAAALAASCATNPVTGRRELSLVSEGQELSLGREGYAAVVSEYGRYDDASVQAFVDSVGQALAKVSHRPDLKWTFTVLDDPTVNAFAMPGGYIYITRGILAHLGSEAQLAGVMGHEIGHVTARHGARQMTQQQLMGVGLALGSAFSTTLREHGAEAQQALGLLLLKYGRDDENEADGLGVDYSVKAGWDPRQIPATYATLRRIGERSGQRLPGFLSTHPDPGDREQRTAGLSAQAAAGKTGLIVRQRDYVRRLEGMVFGADPRNGYFDGARYTQPTMGFEITFPSGWTTRDQASGVSAAAPSQAGQMQLGLAKAGDLTPTAFVDALRQKGAVTAANGRAETVGGWPAWVGNLAVPDGQGGTTALFAAFVRQSSDRMLEVLGVGRAAAEQEAIARAARSLRPVTDRTRLDVKPDRVRVVAATSTGAFSEVLPKLGAQALGVGESAVLNGLELDETVRTGEALKVVRPGRPR